MDYIKAIYSGCDLVVLNQILFRFFQLYLLLSPSIYKGHRKDQLHRNCMKLLHKFAFDAKDYL